MNPEEELLREEGIRKYIVSKVHVLRRENLQELLHVVQQLVELQESPQKRYRFDETKTSRCVQ